MKKDKTKEEQIAELWADIEVAGYNVYQATIFGNATRREGDQILELKERIGYLLTLVRDIEEAYKKI